MTPQIELNDFQFCVFQEFIHNKFGIFFGEDKKAFISFKLYPHLKNMGFTSFEEYMNLLIHGSANNNELFDLMSLITNNETYFFREYAQLKLLRDYFLPKLKYKKVISKDKKIRILSVGCSSGEEAYSLSMMLFESGQFFWDWDVSTIGIDISNLALAKAKKGIYSNRSFRMTDSYYIRQFFNHHSEHCYQIKNSITRTTDFVLGNILDKKIWDELAPVDIIFCRNVLIYFSDEKIKQTLDHFYKSLRKEGLLFLGHSELIRGVFQRFEPMQFPEAVVYRRL